MKQISFFPLGKHELLLVDGLPQSMNPPSKTQGYWRKMVPGTNPKTVLILGLGGGTVARMLLEKYPNIKITGVDNNKELVFQANTLWEQPAVNVVDADAFAFVKEEKKMYDLIIVDIYDGWSLDLRAFSEDFLNRCKELLNKNGLLCINAPNLDMLIKKLGKVKSKWVETNKIYRYRKT